MQNKEKQTLTLEETQGLLDVINNEQVHLAATLMFYNGLRGGEVINLKVNDVNME